MKALGSFVFPSSRLFTNTADVILRGPRVVPTSPPGGALHLRRLNTGWSDAVYIAASH